MEQVWFSAAIWFGADVPFAFVALFGLNHGIVSAVRYSYLVATVIGSAVIPTAMANAWFMPRCLPRGRKALERLPAIAEKSAE